jgi:hypothetical protein
LSRPVTALITNASRVRFPPASAPSDSSAGLPVFRRRSGVVLYACRSFSSSVTSASSIWATWGTRTEAVTVFIAVLRRRERMGTVSTGPGQQNPAGPEEPEMEYLLLKGVHPHSDQVFLKIRHFHFLPGPLPFDCHRFQGVFHTEPGHRRSPGRRDRCRHLVDVNIHLPGQSAHRRCRDGPGLGICLRPTDTLCVGFGLTLV